MYLTRSGGVNPNALPIFLRVLIRTTWDSSDAWCPAISTSKFGLVPSSRCTMARQWNLANRAVAADSVMTRWQARLPSRRDIPV